VNRVHVKGPQVLLDSLAELDGFVVGEDAAAVVAAGTDFAYHDDPVGYAWSACRMSSLTTWGP
jgi:hypothetical protein